MSPVGPQPALLQAVFEKMQHEAKEVQEEAKAKGLEDHIQKTKELTAETAPQVIPILRMTRCYSKPTKPKNYKVKLLMKQTSSGMQSMLNTFFVSQGKNKSRSPQAICHGHRGQHLPAQAARITDQT